MKINDIRYQYIQNIIQINKKYVDDKMKFKTDEFIGKGDFNLLKYRGKMSITN